AVAALAVCVAPAYAVLDHWLMMNAFEPLIWMGVLWCVLRIVNSGNGHLWITVGVLAGIGLETKYSIAILLAGICAGLLLTPERRWFRHPSLWIGLAICAVIALPNF